MFNCPTHRRTVNSFQLPENHLYFHQVEKRTKKKFGSKEWGTWRIPVVNKRIRVDHEVHRAKCKIRFLSSLVVQIDNYEFRQESTLSWESLPLGSTRK